MFNAAELLDLSQLVDISAFPSIKEKKEDKRLDLVFVEGLVATKNDLARIKELREKADTLVAVGASSTTGGVPAYRNFIDTPKYASLVYEKVKEISDVPPTPINEHVAVDYYIEGCPPDKKQVYSFIKDALLGKTPQDYERSVCFECTLNENHCLLEDGKMCLGPITRGGCDSICINGNLECWGCRGPTPDANVPLMTKVLEEKGYSREHIKQRLRTFVGMQLEKPTLETFKPVKMKKQKKPEFNRVGYSTTEADEINKGVRTLKFTKVKKNPSVPQNKMSTKFNKSKKLKKVVGRKVTQRKLLKKKSVVRTVVKKKSSNLKKVNSKNKRSVSAGQRKSVKKVSKNFNRKTKIKPKNQSTGKKSNKSIMKMIKGLKKK